MNRRRFGEIGLTMLAAFGLVACGKETTQQSTLSPPQTYALAATAHGFSVGSMMSTNTAYIFFDSGCLHCAVLWGNAKPLANKLRIVWIPVGFLARTSVEQSSAILASPDPVLAMDAHEARILKGGSALANAPYGTEAEKKVLDNNGILKKLGVAGVPLIIYKNAKTGEYGSHIGQMDTAQLAELLGV